MYPIVHWTQTDESLELKPDSIHIWQIDLEQPLDKLEPLLSTDEMVRAERFIRPPLRQRYIAARGAMRHILGRYLRLSGDELRFDYSAQGKPTLQNPGATLQFNLSHCQKMALLALSTQPIGIDLEQLQQRSNLLQIAERVFPQRVQQELSNLSGEELTQMFLHHWTELESCAKCRGDGIFSSSGEPVSCYTMHLTPAPGWIACIAAATALPAAESWDHYKFIL